MSIEHRIGPEGRDDDVTRELRRLYAAPADDAYWQGLQERILAAVAGRPLAASEGWWVALERWSRIGALAAAAALCIAGAALWRAREVREEAALQAMMLHPNTPSAQIAAVAGRSPDNDAVLRDVLTP